MNTALAERQTELVLISFEPQLLKARAAEEGGQRIVFAEAANEAWDQEGERIETGALLGSVGLFLSKGNIDLEHKSFIGERLGLPNPREYEIGRPLEVLSGDRRVFVKGFIYRGLERADWFWKSLTTVAPPMPWFASVGGIPTKRRTVFDKAAGKHRSIVTEARWVNLAFAREPINLSVPAVSVTPFGEFAKAAAWALAQPECDGESCECVKAITAGYGTDSATLTGGAALRRQSLHGAVLSPWDEQATRYLKAIGTPSCDHTGVSGPITHETITDHFATCEGLEHAEAKRAAARFLTTIARRREERAAA
jgi:hypothetical protein